MPENGRTSEEAELRRSMVGSSTWCIDNVVFGDDHVRIGGWALPDTSGAAGTFSMNGREPTTVECDIARSDIAHLFWFWPDAGTSGFNATFALDRATPRPQLTFDHVDASTGRPFNERHRYFYPPADFDKLPLPAAEQQVRVQGRANDEIFALDGYSAFTKIITTVERHTGRSRGELGRVLDWGCGCGRLSRYFAGLRRTELVGVDIDRANALWCRDHLGFGQFSAVPLRPPCPQLRSRWFDVVIGMSVMTHLTVADERAWLDELARITKSDGVVALTVHGGATMAKSETSMSDLEAWQVRGHFEGGMNVDLLDAIDEPDFYRDSFRTPHHVGSTWSRLFDITEYIEGFVGNHHDLVVMRRKRRRGIDRFRDPPSTAAVVSGAATT